MTSRIPLRGPFAAPVCDYIHNLFVRSDLARLARDNPGRLASVDAVARVVGGKKKHSAELCKRIAKHLDTQPVPREPSVPEAPVLENVMTFCGALGLDSGTRTLLVFSAALRNDRGLAAVFGLFGELDRVEVRQLISAATGLSLAKSQAALDELAKSGLVAVEDWESTLDRVVRLDSRLLGALLTPSLDHAQLVASFLSRAPPPTLNVDDFEPIAEALGLGRELIKALFDEADSLLRDRRAAVRSWEVTQVNELLQQVEQFRGVVAFTTNLWREIDPAALRRFVFKVELRYLRPDQARELFRSSFSDLLDEPDGLLESGLDEGLVDLAPGDFAAVRRKVLALGWPRSVAELCALLRAETEARGHAPRKIGFGRIAQREPKTRSS